METKISVSIHRHIETYTMQCSNTISYSRHAASAIQWFCIGDTTLTHQHTKRQTNLIVLFFNTTPWAIPIITSDEENKLLILPAINHSPTHTYRMPTLHNLPKSYLPKTLKEIFSTDRLLHVRLRNHSHYFIPSDQC